MMHRYLLVDGARYHNALARLYARNEVLEVEPLYFGSPWHSAADLGPLLVSTDSASALFYEIETSAELRASAAVLESRALADVVASHLRRFNQVTDVSGAATLLRYADPQVAWFWLHSYDADALSSVMGPITRWRIAAPPNVLLSQQPQHWHDFASARPAAQSGLPAGLLGPPQLSALQQAYQQQLKERLYRWLQENHQTALSALPEQTRDNWFNARLVDAEGFGLSTERSIAIWCELALRDGSDFAGNPQGPYRRWLARAPRELPATPDQRLQHYCRDRATAPIRDDETHDRLA